MPLEMSRLTLQIFSAPEFTDEQPTAKGRFVMDSLERQGGYGAAIIKFRMTDLNALRMSEITCQT